MRVPCPVPLQSPWSPAGYQVVQVAEEQVPAARPQGGKAGPQPARLPSSGVGYKVIQVVDEQGPALQRAPVPNVRLRRAPRPSRSRPVWSAALAGGLGLVLFFVVLVVMGLAMQSSAPPLAPVVVAPNVVEVPPPVDVPAGGCRMPPGWERVAEVNLVADVDPAAEKKVQPEPMPLLDKTACKAEPPAGRETFGTAVSFVRNPSEALRIAGQERKLAFVLHVSGDFEDSRFT
jgi:hypothetical protein